MNQAQNHIIEKVFLEINMQDSDLAFSIQKIISRFLENELFPKIETLFNDYNVSDGIIRFDKMNIDFTVPNLNSFELVKDEILRQVQRKLENLLFFEISAEFHYNSDIDSVEIKQLTSLENAESIFIFFLENGIIPWYGKTSVLNDFSEPLNWEKLLQNSLFFEKLKHLVNTNQIATKRFVSQFQNEIVVEFLSRFNHALKDWEDTILEVANSVEVRTRNTFLFLLFEISVAEYSETAKSLLFKFFQSDKTGILKNKFAQKFSTEFIKRLNNEYYKDDLGLKGEIQKHDDTKEFEFKKPPQYLEDQIFIHEKDENENQIFGEKITEIAVRNAGLVLLHPFLKPFFIETKIADEKGFILTDKLDLAIQSLHFLSTGNENVFESELVFEKFLCGVPLKMPVLRQSLLTYEIKTEAIEMLTQVIKYWSALKNTSPSGLREAFIQRNGKIVKDEHGFKLFVERKTQDILLDSINWNFKIVQIFRLTELLFVEW